MTTIQNNSRQLIEVNFIGECGKPCTLRFLPGVNLNQDPSLWKYAKNHPAVRSWLDQGILVNLSRTPTAEGEIEGISVITAPGDGEPLPINGEPKQRKPRAPKPDPAILDL